LETLSPPHFLFDPRLVFFLIHLGCYFPSLRPGFVIGVERLFWRLSPTLTSTTRGSSPSFEFSFNTCQYSSLFFDLSLCSNLRFPHPSLSLLALNLTPPSSPAHSLSLPHHSPSTPPPYCLPFTPSPPPHPPVPSHLLPPLSLSPYQPFIPHPASQLPTPHSPSSSPPPLAQPLPPALSTDPGPPS